MAKRLTERAISVGISSILARETHIPKATEMSTKTKRRPLAERLKQGLREGIQFAKGELTLRTIEVPSPPADIAAKEVTALREKAGMSQTVFARVLNVSTKTVQSWEQGQRKPSHAALRILQVFRSRPQVVCEVVGLRNE
jgi:putative transcriptional regulator